MYCSLSTNVHISTYYVLLIWLRDEPTLMRSGAHVYVRMCIHHCHMIQIALEYQSYMYHEIGVLTF